MASHQIELHPDSRDITTFATPNGLYRYKSLLFGVKIATEKFTKLFGKSSRTVWVRTTSMMTCK